MTQQGRRDAVLISGILIGPLALLTNVLVGSSLAPWVCAAQSVPALFAIQCAFLLVAAGSGWMSWRDWSREGRDWPDESADRESRSRFLAIVGLLVSALSALQIFATLLTTAILGACQ